MKKALILLAGYPGTGKSYLSVRIRNIAGDIVQISPDEIKEKVWDAVGFSNQEEKDQLILRSWTSYYQQLERYLREGETVLSDYPFSKKQKPTLQRLIKKYEYQVITIRLIAEFDVLFDRQRKRDMDEKRHAGHILMSYHQGEKIADRRNADALVSYAEFKQRYQTRGHGKFSLGKLLEVDVSDFKTVNYDAIEAVVMQFLDAAKE